MDSVTQPRVFVIGDSLSIQFGPYLEEALKGYFRYDRKRDSGGQRADDDLDIPQGANGGDSSMVLAYLKKRQVEDPIAADILLLSTGLHDIKTKLETGEKQVALKRFEQNLEEIIAMSRSMALQLVWMRIAPVLDKIHNKPSMAFHRFAADVAAYNAVADRIMEESGVPVIDFHEFCLALVPEMLIDHVHYSEEAREKQGKFLTTELIRRFS